MDHDFSIGSKFYSDIYHSTQWAQLNTCFELVLLIQVIGSF